MDIDKYLGLYFMYLRYLIIDVDLLVTFENFNQHCKVIKELGLKIVKAKAR